MTDVAKSTNMTCLTCNRQLTEQKTLFTYLQFNFSAPLPRCPICGQVFISEEFVEGKLSDVETTLEDK